MDRTLHIVSLVPVRVIKRRPRRPVFLSSINNNAICTSQPFLPFRCRLVNVIYCVVVATVMAVWPRHVVIAKIKAGAILRGWQEMSARCLGEVRLPVNLIPPTAPTVFSLVVTHI